jgi:hypothetical protein
LTALHHGPELANLAAQRRLTLPKAGRTESAIRTLVLWRVFTLRDSSWSLLSRDIRRYVSGEIAIN